MRQPRLMQLLPVLGADRLTEPGPLGIGYFSTSTTYRRTVLYALSRWGARSAQAFDL